MLYYPLKRLIDIIGALLLLIILGPLMLVTMLWIYIVSPGPILADIPERVGKNGKPFRMFKFRSMIPKAHDWLIAHPDIYRRYKENSYKLDPDPRFIPGAKFLRKLSIDEWPQFVNILKGDMSLVGPRPYYSFELKEQQQVYPETAKHISELLKAKPGLSGVWQVGGRSNIDFPERARMDADYAKRKSLLYDLYILFKTPLAVLSGKGAS